MRLFRNGLQPYLVSLPLAAGNDGDNAGLGNAVLRTLPGNLPVPDRAALLHPDDDGGRYDALQPLRIQSLDEVTEC